jgi:hypothetical protein
MGRPIGLGKWRLTMPLVRHLSLLLRHRLPGRTQPLPSCPPTPVPVPTPLSPSLPTRSVRGIALALALALTSPLAPAQEPANQAEPDPTYAVQPLRIESSAAPTIDGRLDDEVWARATRLGNLTQVEPNEGEAPSQRTETLLCFDADAFYLGIRCFDDDVASLRATQRRRDSNLDPDDSIEVVFDPFLDRRNAFWFQISPGGARGDALIVKNGAQFNKRWDGIWSGKSTIAEDGWFAELRIPFATLNFTPDQTTWGFNFRRLIRRNSEEARWATPSQESRFFYISDAGDMTGMSGMTQGLGLDFTPFFVGDWNVETESGGGDGDSDTNLEGGFDLFWRPTPDTKLSLSYNTDFAETEVDSTQVNLTRFSLFFPEKRDFFLEDSGAFFFGPSSGGGGGSSDVVPFFSRRIGLSASEEVPIIGALKYTGQTDTGTFGVLGAATDSAELDGGSVDDQGLFAARYSHNIDSETDAGFLVTSGDPDGLDRGAATFGLDWNWRTRSFNGGETLKASAYVLGATNDPDSEVSGLPMAMHASIDYPSDELRMDAGFTYVNDDFDPALGFVRRTGIKKYEAELEFRPRLTGHKYIKRLEFGIEPTLITGTANQLESLGLEFKLIEARFHSGDSISLDVLHDVDVLDEDFNLVDVIPVLADRYEATRVGIRLRAADRREVSGRLSVFAGQFWDGMRTDYNTSVNWRPGPLGSMRLGFERNELDLDGGSIDINVASLRCDLNFTPDISWSNTFQWDNISDEVSLNSRLWVLLGPGRDLFFVVNQGWDSANSDIIPTSTGVALKVGYTFRF